MSEAALTAPPGSTTTRRTFDYRKLVDAMFWLTVASGSVVSIQPSPYDILILITLALWALGGFSVHRAALPLILFLSLWVLGGFIGLIPYWDEPDPISFMWHTLFISTTGVFFALFISQRTSRRLDLMLNAYVISCVFAAIIGLLGWLQVLSIGHGERLYNANRAMGFFKDPNVFGTYLVLGIVCLAQRLLIGRQRRLWLVLPSLAIMVVGNFLAFSRGSWGAAIIAVAMNIVFLLITADSRAMRRRVALTTAMVALAGALAFSGAMTDSHIRNFFFQRAHVEKSYDKGPNGRFGHQEEFIPMMFELPNGMGPLRFRLTFGLEPHSSYINAFASNGWLGGFSFILMVLSTCFVGFRQCLTRHPWTRQAQVLFATTFVAFLQGFQIDIDHWRQYYLALGAVWGIEAARRRWLAHRPRTEPAAPARAAIAEPPQAGREGFNTNA